MHSDLTSSVHQYRINPWYSDAEKTGDDLGDYLAIEQNREKIAVLLRYLSLLEFSIDYERAYLKVFETKNTGAIAELVRYGCRPPTDDVLAKGKERDMFRLHCTKDINLETKFRDPNISLTRKKHPIAIRQAYYLLGTNSMKSPTMTDLFDLAIKTNNKRAFFYLIHSNINFDVTELAFRLIEERNTDFIKEMCRQDYKFDMKNKNDETAVLYAVGKIDPEDFGCFFHKAGRINAVVDNKLLCKLDTMMLDCEAVKRELRRKPMSQVPIFSLDYDDYPKVDYPMVKDTLTSLEPPESMRASRDESESMRTSRRTPESVRTSRKASESVRTSRKASESVDTYKVTALDERDGKNNYQVSVTYDEVTKYYQLNKKMISVSGLLDVMYSDVTEGESVEVLPLHGGFASVEGYEILLSFMKGVSSGESYDCTDGCPQWLQNMLGGCNMKLLIEVCEVAYYLDVFKIYDVLAYYMNNIARNKTTEELRYIISVCSNRFDFETIDFSTFIKSGKLGGTEI
jgi:hypothetical protein